MFHVIDICYFRIVAYSPSTSHVTAHMLHADALHKFMEAEGVRVEPMAEASGTVLRCFSDESGRVIMDTEEGIVTFVADATPAVLHPLLLRWHETLSKPSVEIP